MAAATLKGGGFNAYNVAAQTMTAGQFTTGNFAYFQVLFRNGVTQGNVVVRFAAETTGTVTIKDGSVLRYKKLD